MLLYGVFHISVVCGFVLALCIFLENMLIPTSKCFIFIFFLIIVWIFFFFFFKDYDAKLSLKSGL